MSSSVESRVPYVDLHVHSVAAGLANDQFVEDAISKRALRDVAGRYLPDAVVTRRDKIGFFANEVGWIRGRGTEQIRGILDDHRQTISSVLGETFHHDLLGMVDGTETYDSSLWRVVTFSLWCEAFGLSL